MQAHEWFSGIDWEELSSKFDLSTLILERQLVPLDSSEKRKRSQVVRLLCMIVSFDVGANWQVTVDLPPKIRFKLHGSLQRI